jgi:hypothetical protein
MAICWSATIHQLDGELAFAPERYSARHHAHAAETRATVPLHRLVRLAKSTVNPAQSDPDGRYMVLDTTHAVEGRIQSSAHPVRGRDVGSVKRPVRSGSVLVSRLRTYLRQVAYVDEGFVDRHKLPLVCSTEFYILEPADPKDSIAFLVPYLLSPGVQAVFAHAQEGGHHPRMHASVLTDLPVPVKLLRKREELSRRLIEGLGILREAERLLAGCAQALDGIV